MPRGCVGSADSIDDVQQATLHFDASVYNSLGSTGTMHNNSLDRTTFVYHESRIIINDLRNRRGVHITVIVVES